MRIAVIIPTLEEARRLDATIRCLREGGSPDVLVVADCGSSDGTVDIARAARADVVTGSQVKSRATAMQAGADRAVELADDLDVLWFLHADTRVPRAWREALQRVLAAPHTIGGGFAHRFDRDGVGWIRGAQLRAVELVNSVRYRLTRTYYGDHGIFVRPGALRQVGGVPDVPLFEDIELCRSLRRVGRLRTAPARVVTSPRRFLRTGVFRQLLFDAVLVTANEMGVRPRRLMERYNHSNGDEPSPPVH
jgi:rSAM/selenodomain-associated transferase 2